MKQKFSILAVIFSFVLIINIFKEEIILIRAEQIELETVQKVYLNNSACRIEGEEKGFIQMPEPPRNLIRAGMGFDYVVYFEAEMTANKTEYAFEETNRLVIDRLNNAIQRLSDAETNLSLAQDSVGRQCIPGIPCQGGLVCVRQGLVCQSGSCPPGVMVMGCLETAWSDCATGNITRAQQDACSAAQVALSRAEAELYATRIESEAAQIAYDNALRIYEQNKVICNAWRARDNFGFDVNSPINIFHTFEREKEKPNPLIINISSRNRELVKIVIEEETTGGGGTNCEYEPVEECRNIGSSEFLPIVGSMEACEVNGAYVPEALCPSGSTITHYLFPQTLFQKRADRNEYCITNIEPYPNMYYGCFWTNESGNIGGTWDVPEFLIAQFPHCQRNQEKNVYVTSWVNDVYFSYCDLECSTQMKRVCVDGDTVMHIKKKYTVQLPRVYIEKHTGKLLNAPTGFYYDGGNKFHTDLKALNNKNYEINTDIDFNWNGWELNNHIEEYRVRNYFAPAIGEYPEYRFRPISLTIPFPERNPGTNWRGYENYISPIKRGQPLYSDDNIMYEINLSADIIKKIRNYNERHEYVVPRLDSQGQNIFIYDEFRNIFRIGGDK